MIDLYSVIIVSLILALKGGSKASSGVSKKKSTKLEKSIRTLPAPVSIKVGTEIEMPKIVVN
jgi:hypothetical protein